MVQKTLALLCPGEADTESVTNAASQRMTGIA
jgi:hypothetical protein